MNYHFLFPIFLILFVLAILFWPNKTASGANYDVRVLAHSIGNSAANALISLYLMYPRFIHAEMMTHKDFSRSASSSRAIPVMKMLRQVWSNPAVPLHWGVNQPGMQASMFMIGVRLNAMRNLWQLAGRIMCVIVWVMAKAGVHKQTANRLLEPWQLMHVTLTTCKLSNFFTLRCHKDAQPEIQYLAGLMLTAVKASTPKKLKPGEWHLPWIEKEDWRYARQYDQFQPISDIPYDTRILEILKKQSAARCARSSYALFDGDRDLDKDLGLFDKLVHSKPVHASPCEHQATPDVQVGSRNGLIWLNQALHANLTGWIQHRGQITGHYEETYPGLHKL